MLSKRSLRLSVAMQHAETGIELERYRLSHGHYPKSLDLLADRFDPDHHFDRFSGHPMNYRLLDDGFYELYSVGLNKTDDGGQLKKPVDEGDWVWRLSLPPDLNGRAP